VADLLESDPGITVVGEGRNAAEALARVPALRPDVAVLGVRLPTVTASRCAGSCAPGWAT
jgi:chemotaxis response regulator CheB